ncbi:unnamed protein product [Ceutorhynchus assimilis]|uniref:Uncharacterized protein n=1 Tax=Ceutorhynchus assimilis TaxID=467358 RepID=A0A9P0DD93_9CUCU|nr:unnamed protein product [Ceutorhynchus assimilis]
MMFRIFLFCAFSVALSTAGNQIAQYVQEQQQHGVDEHVQYQEQEQYDGGQYESEHISEDENKEASGAELTSLAHTSAVQAKNAVQSQHTAGSQAAFGIKSTLATAAQGAAQTAQAALVGKQAIVYGLKKQLNEAEKRLQAEISQYKQTEQAAELAHQVAQQVQNQAATLSAALAAAQSGGQLAAKSAAEANNVAASQQSMVAHAKQKLNVLLHQLQEAVQELHQTETAYYKASESAQIAQKNAAAAGAAVVEASGQAEIESSNHHYHH